MAASTIQILKSEISEIMEIVEELLLRADFSRESNLEQRLFAQFTAGKAPAAKAPSASAPVADASVAKAPSASAPAANASMTKPPGAKTISLNDLMKKSDAGARGPQSEEKGSFRDRVREGAEKRREAARTRDKGHGRDGAAMNNDRPILPNR